MRFQGEFEFLSNFFPAEVTMGGLWFPTVEHAYQAAKTLVEEERLQVLACSTPGRAKRMGRKVTVRPDWEQVKVEVMRFLLIQKFNRPGLREKLLAIEGEIEETNGWGDTFWGRCEGVGENVLGKLLMEIREQIR